MHQAIKSQWVAALRSDDYVQGSTYLSTQRADGTVDHCTFGVLCDLAARAGVIEPPVLAEGRWFFEFGPSKRICELPIEVMKWAGLNSSLPEVIYAPDGGTHGAPVSIVELNDPDDDGNHLTFGEIADVIDGSL